MASARALASPADAAFASTTFLAALSAFLARFASAIASRTLD